MTKKKLPILFGPDLDLPIRGRESIKQYLGVSEHMFRLLEPELKAAGAIIHAPRTIPSNPGKRTRCQSNYGLLTWPSLLQRWAVARGSLMPAGYEHGYLGRPKMKRQDNDAGDDNDGNTTG